MDFKRSLICQEYESWLGMQECLHDVLLTGNKDVVIWGLNRKNQFTTKSLYRFLTDRGVPSKATRYIWKSKVPLKIKFFLWHVFNNKLQVAQNFIKKGWHRDGVCSLCGCEEIVNHILFECHLEKLTGASSRKSFA